MRRAALLLALAAGTAHANGITIVNGGGGTIREIHLYPDGAANPGPNRLRTTLPPGATAEIGYSTGCQAAALLVYQDGRSETFAGLDACTGARLVSGQGVTGQSVTAARTPAPAKPSAFKLPHVDVPWTGRSITRRFGGMN